MNRSFPRRMAAAAAAVVMVLPGVVACGGDDGDTLTIYSGRNENLVGPLLEELEDVTGVKVEVRYGGSAEMAAQLLEEGDNTDADLFFSQDAGALGALSDAGMLAELPQDSLDVVEERFRAADGTWVATSARARVVAYDPGQVDESELPGSAEELLDPKWEGKIGFAPRNASWHSFVTSLRVLLGEDGARAWLESFKDNAPEAFENNIATLDAVDAGEVALGLINHYYYFPKVKELGEDNVNAELHYVGGDDPLALVNVAGVGVIEGGSASDAALAAVEYLLSERGQQYFADETAEYPVRTGVESTEYDLPPLTDIQSPDIDLADLASLTETLDLLREVGLLD